MRATRFIISIALLLAAVSMHAQSVELAKIYIRQGNYVDAAKQLRPLADTGDAEAQYLAATLFFDGKGVKQSNAQGVKYASMAARQGHQKATALMAECYYTGRGISTDKEKAWQMMRNNADGADFRQRHEQDYWHYKLRTSGMACMEDYADQLYGLGQLDDFEQLVHYIEQYEYGSSALQLKAKAESGNAWAMARLAKVYDEQGYRATAREWVTKSVNAGSAYGRAVAKKVMYEPQSYDNVSWSYMPTGLSITKVVQDYDQTIVHLRFRNYTSARWIYVDKNAHVEHNGRTYRMVHSTLPDEPNIHPIAPDEEVHFSISFQRIPDGASGFTLVDGAWRITGIKF